MRRIITVAGKAPRPSSSEALKRTPSFELTVNKPLLMKLEGAARQHLSGADADRNPNQEKYEPRDAF